MTKKNMPARRDIPAKKVGSWPTEGMNEAQLAEAAVIEARREARPKRPEIVCKTKDGVMAIVIGDGSDADKTLASMRLYEAFGGRDHAFTDFALHRLSEALKLTGDDAQDSGALSGALALVAAIGPQNELEATMALQMVAANEAVHSCFNRSRKSDYLEHATAFSNMANKAMRSFALHAETLAKLRRGGEQVVRHVHVGDGGQAVIAGTVNTAPRGV